MVADTATVLVGVVTEVVVVGTTGLAVEAGGVVDLSLTDDDDSACEGVDAARCGAAGDGDDDAVSLAGVILAVFGVVATAAPVLTVETESPWVVVVALAATDLELVAAVMALGTGGGGIGGGLPGVSTMCGAMKPWSSVGSVAGCMFTSFCNSDMLG